MDLPPGRRALPEPGIPDLLICIDGLLIGMEIKFPGPGESIEHAERGRPSYSAKQIRAINAAGGMAGVVTSVAEALDHCQRAFRKRDALSREKEKAWLSQPSRS